MPQFARTSIGGRASSATKSINVEIPPIKESLLIASGALLGAAAGSVLGMPLGILAGAKLAKEQWVK